jgi:hypothetical protein
MVLGTNNADRLTVSGAGAIQFHAYGAGVLTTDASGNVTATGTPSIATSLTVPTIYGSAASAGDLLLSSTSHATKGKIKLGGDSFYFHQTLGCLMLGDSGGSELGHLDVRRATGVIAAFGQTLAENPTYGPGQVYIVPGSINSRYYYDQDGLGLYINYAGYLNSTSYYRSTWIGDGKNNNIATFDGSNRCVGLTTASPIHRLHLLNVNVDSAVSGLCMEGAWPWWYLKDWEPGQDSWVGYTDEGIFRLKSIPYADRNGANLDAVGSMRYEFRNDGRFRIMNSYTPGSAGDPGNAGQICWDANYLYVCVATNTWKRAAIATW